LCFSCDRIFHQRCANVVDTDLSDKKTPWICHDCLKDPLNAHATQFFKSVRYKLFLKDRLEKFTTENDLPSPVREKDKEESDREYLDSFFDISKAFTLGIFGINPEKSQKIPKNPRKSQKIPKIPTFLAHFPNSV